MLVHLMREKRRKTNRNIAVLQMHVFMWHGMNCYVAIMMNEKLDALENGSELSRFRPTAAVTTATAMNLCEFRMCATICLWSTFSLKTSHVYAYLIHIRIRMPNIISFDYFYSKINWTIDFPIDQIDFMPFIISWSIICFKSVDLTNFWFHLILCKFLSCSCCLI